MREIFMLYRAESKLLEDCLGTHGSVDHDWETVHYTDWEVIQMTFIKKKECLTFNSVTYLLEMTIIIIIIIIIIPYAFRTTKNCH